MGITISKQKQNKLATKSGKSFTFYRVKNNGVFLQDFKTKAKATSFAKKKRK